MFTPVNITLIITATITALMAGLFFAWSCSVTPGLGRLPDASYISAFQSCNRAIQNPVFLICFLGGLVLLPVSAWLHYTPAPSIHFWLLLAASLLYAAGVIGVTFAGNIPLNEALDKFDLQQASTEAITQARERFEKRWNDLNLIRTVASTLSVILVVMACLSKYKEQGIS
ncbi:anthrone oxygenase family protein [Chitinophaga cymbidii]|uniref:DUF1772 domain-containing protein n=1 Tax=Chitinophaga cymbidii TaxID=1096750 RepID=A0A512RQN7_9BACT|nr:DUF1772 domain-containing protein [Chitinophaga cymbidii]GEP98012.1 hypothetical protein CCY01nite_42720 [Chitinophaga cymbidii]